MEFSQRLRQLRLEKNLLQKQIATQLGYNYTVITNYESGRNEPRIKDLKKLAQILDVSMDYLTGLTDEKIKEQFKVIIDEEPMFDQVLDKLYQTAPVLNRTQLNLLIQFIDYLYFMEQKKDSLSSASGENRQ